MADWEIDLSEVNGLRYWYRGQPKMVQRASAMLLNEFAFGTYNEAHRTIKALMTVRNERFMHNRLRVTKAVLSAPIAQQRSITGSVATARFSGWVEQEKGTPTMRKRVSTLAARGGTFSRQMLPRTRLKPANEVRTLEQTGKVPRGGAGNVSGIIAMLARDGYKGLIRIKGGLYMVDKGGRRIMGPTRNGRGKLTTLPHLSLVQKFKREQPKRKHWLTDARAGYFKKHHPEVTWKRVVDRIIRPPKKR